MRPQRRIAPTATELHRRWLELVDADGPFLAVPPLKRVWPQGMPTLDGNARAKLSESKPAFEQAWDLWDRVRSDAAVIARYIEARNAWVDTVLRDVAGWGELLIAAPDVLALSSIRAWSPNRSVSVGVTGALMREDTIGALLLAVDPVDSLRDIVDDGWAASPIDRMEALLRASDTAIGLVTDGRWWALVCARDGAMAASGIVDSQTWIDQKDTRDAFFALLQLSHLVGGKAEDRLPVLFKESIAAAEEITEALGVQVRRAVELLVSALSEAAVDARDNGQPDPLPASRGAVYDAAVTVMMRIVFLLFAEERNLLPQGQLFTMGYGITGELDALSERSREETSEALDATHLTWYRLLSTSQALYSGATFEDMRLPSYGGSLFDPARFPFLLDRQPRGTLAVTVSDRVMLEVLRAVQIAQLKGQPARRISFRDIDVEQIGYIYEGLLGYSCADVDEITVGLTGSAGSEPELTLNDLEDLAGKASTESELADAVVAHLKETQSGAKPATKAAITKALANPGDGASIELALLSVTTDPALRDRLRPFAGIIRRDLRDRPVIVQPGGLVVVETPSRASAGAHYTPKSLAEEVVEHALQPLVFQPGPHQTNDETQWIPLSSDRILDLKVADIACGSGAFLVAAARYLARRLVEAWHRERVDVGDPHDLYVHALRQVLANCIYGADINAMAVEMCKLSLWLVSLDPKQSFSFVDDKVLHGNSLLGLTDVRQLKAMNIDPNAMRSQTSLYDIDIDGVLAQAVSLRRRLATEVDDRDPQRSATSKRRQWADYQVLVAPLAHAADAVVAAGLVLGGKPGKALDEAYENLQFAVGLAYPGAGAADDKRMLDAIIAPGLRPTVATDYDRWRPLHWVLTVPDVMERGGFDAVIGNPPFLGGKKLSGALGPNVREWLVNCLARGAKGNADLVAYFFLRAHALLNGRGNLGLIATNTVAQGDTREVGLDQMVATGFAITRSIQSRPWPAASASLEYAAVWGTSASVQQDIIRVSDGVPVGRISTLLEPEGRVSGLPARLSENGSLSFIGCFVLGMGFIVDPVEAAE
jgi:type I restriction-modification system DNA methylase subunit